VQNTADKGAFLESVEVMAESAKQLCLYGTAHQASLPHGAQRDHFHLDACQWAVSMVASRAWTLPHPKDASVRRSVLIPVLDMANHRQWGGSVYCKQDFCNYTANQDIEPGDELFVNYELNSDTAVQRYGFVVPPSQHLHQPTWDPPTRAGDRRQGGVRYTTMSSYYSHPQPRNSSHHEGYCPVEDLVHQIQLADALCCDAGREHAHMSASHHGAWLSWM